MFPEKQHLNYDKRPALYLKSGERPLKNAFCPHYGDCLDMAVKANWPQFTCANCRNRDLRVKIAPDSLEVANYYRLLEKIFSLK